MYVLCKTENKACLNRDKIVLLLLPHRQKREKKNTLNVNCYHAYGVRENKTGFIYIVVNGYLRCAIAFVIYKYYVKMSLDNNTWLSRHFQP